MKATQRIVKEHYSFTEVLCDTIYMKKKEIVKYINFVVAADSRASYFSYYFSFIEAGSEIILTGSYQASIEGFVKHAGVTEEQAYSLIKKSVQLAQQAVEEVSKVSGEVWKFENICKLHTSIKII